MKEVNGVSNCIMLLQAHKDKGLPLIPDQLLRELWMVLVYEELSDIRLDLKWGEICSECDTMTIDEIKAYHAYIRSQKKVKLSNV